MSWLEFSLLMVTPFAFMVSFGIFGFFFLKRPL
jgi:hypothetical protein